MRNRQKKIAGEGASVTKCSTCDSDKHSTGQAKLLIDPAGKHVFKQNSAQLEDMCAKNMQYLASRSAISTK